MSISFTRYPIDIIVCIIWAIILTFIGLLPLDTTIRIILGLPFILFIPGYTLIFALFPTKKIKRGIDEIERIGLSFGFSIAITSLLGLILNYTPRGITLESILLTLLIFTVSLGIIALYRWNRVNSNQRFIIYLKASNLKSNKPLDKILTIILTLSILIAVASIFYIIVTPKNGETFTEFYILTTNGNSTNYPQDITKSENTSIILGLINHEYKMMNYTIEIWLINETTQKNETIYNHAWFMDKKVVSLNHTEITNEQNQIKKWEYYYTFTIK